MLGLGASHLGMLNNQGYMKEALDHRVKAIKCLNEFLNKGCKTQADADAAFGTVLSLTFQSSYMPDGLGDFLSMIRGCESRSTTSQSNTDNSEVLLSALMPSMRCRLPGSSACHV